MKIENGMLFFIVKLKQGENIDHFLSQIPSHDKRFEQETNSWEIHNKHKSQFLKSIKKKDQLNLFE